MLKSVSGGGVPASDGLHFPKDAMFKLILLQTAALGFHWDRVNLNTLASLRGLDVVSGQIVWASGTNGTFLLTNDGGLHRRAAQVPGAESLDFRDIQAFDATTAYLLASGEGEESRLIKAPTAARTGGCCLLIGTRRVF